MKYRYRRNPDDQAQRDLLRQAIATNDPQLGYQAYVQAARSSQLPTLESAPVMQVPTPYGNLYLVPNSAEEVSITNKPPGSPYEYTGDQFVVNRISVYFDIRYHLKTDWYWDYDENQNNIRVEKQVWKRDHNYGNDIYRVGFERYNSPKVSDAIRRIIFDLTEKVLHEWLMNSRGAVNAAEAVAANNFIAKRLGEIEELTQKIIEKQGDIGLAYLKMIGARDRADFGTQSLKHSFVPAAGRPPKDLSKQKCGICSKVKEKHG